MRNVKAIVTSMIMARDSVKCGSDELEIIIVHLSIPMNGDARGRVELSFYAAGNKAK